MQVRKFKKPLDFGNNITKLQIILYLSINLMLFSKNVNIFEIFEITPSFPLLPLFAFYFTDEQTEASLTQYLGSHNE